jgi:DNA-binding MarR family transcriptional regulator
MPRSRTKAPSPLTVRPTEAVFRELLRTLGLLERVMQPYFARFGISGSQWGVLRNLHRAAQEGQPGLRLTDLSERLLLRPPSVSGVVDRLERAGLVIRLGSPTDLRAKQVALTAEGRQLVEQVLAVHGKQIHTVLAGLSPREQGELYHLLQQLGQHLDGLLARNGVVGVG